MLKRLKTDFVSSVLILISGTVFAQIIAYLLSPVITRSFILAFLGKEFNQKYRNGFVHKHFHAPEPDSNNVYVEPGIRRTITVAIPTKIIDEVTEQVCWQEFDYDFVGKTPIYNGDQNVEWQQERSRWRHAVGDGPEENIVGACKFEAGERVSGQQGKDSHE